MADNAVTIYSDGTVSGTSVYLGDQLIPATSVIWSLDLGCYCATAQVELAVDRIETVGHVEWVGLDDVPTEVLDAELTRRKDDT